MNQLAQLQKWTTIVADTGDISSIQKFKPEDATTNPSLILKAIQTGGFDEKLTALKAEHSETSEVMDRIGVEIGSQILSIVPGYVSTEVDARLSFDTEKTLAKARKLISLYEAKGWNRDRVLIKIASTWEGIQAARVLEQEGISCNLTLLFGLEQARACADAGVTLISPFVGRILDWYKKSTGETFDQYTDPGVLSVKDIYKLYKKHGYDTVVMGASFRNVGEILELAGCDKLTISPGLLEELEAEQSEISATLQKPNTTEPKLSPISEAEFRFGMNQNAMATEKLAEGIRNFIADQEKLESLIEAL